MKEQLTIQELSDYLPWEVKVSNYDYSEVVEVTLFTAHDALIAINDGSFMLLLYPLSHLTKEIQHKGERFVPYLFWDDKERISLLSSCATDVIYCEYLEYFIIQKLHEWHFDTFGLIDRGLAIDKTTIL